MIVSLIVAALLQTAPASEAPDNGLPKDDYSLVAWCHGALAGQLEMDAVALADMEKIEGKAAVDARRKADKELEVERRQYLKDYEHALAAAEAASPTMIHAKGVAAEQQGYRMWAATRNKEPIWRMLDWGMWDPNDAGCSDAAKRLQEKSALFGEALKGKPQAPAAEPMPSPTPVEADGDAKPIDAEAKPDPAATPSTPPETEPTPPSSEPAATVATAPPPPQAAPAKPKARAKAVAKPKHKSAEAIRAALATPPTADPPPAPTAESEPAQAAQSSAPSGLRGPQ